MIFTDPVTCLKGRGAPFCQMPQAYEEILLTSWLAANPAQLAADHFGLTVDQVNKFPEDSSGIIAARI